MNLSELPMIFFTVLAQMSVGAFVALGVIQIFARLKFSEKTIDQVTDSALYAIGPVLVVGLIISMFHMNDVFHVFNVFRHASSSWLSREIIFGILFAGFGFLFAILQWFKVGGVWLRQIVAAITAVFGICLLYSMCAIYATLEAVPAWNTWAVPYQFISTAIILGCLAVSMALIYTRLIQEHNRKKQAKDTGAPSGSEGGSGNGKSKSGGLGVKTRLALVNAPADEREWELTTGCVKALTFTAALAAVALLISYPLYIGQLAGGNQVAQRSAEEFAGAEFLIFLILLGTSAVLLAMISFWLANKATPQALNTLAWITTVATIMAFVACLLSRSLHYDVLLRVGI